jgi:hypothetical protein
MNLVLFFANVISVIKGLGQLPNDRLVGLYRIP